VIILIRHAESPVNVSRTLSCRHVDDALTEIGVRQAEQAAAWLARRPIRHIVVSPLKRAVQTAEIIGRRLGLDYMIAEELREIDCGALEGRNDLEAWQAFQHVVFSWFAGDLDAAFDGGETGHSAMQRFARLMQALPDGEGDTLLIGHGGIFAFGLFKLCSELNLAAPRDFYLPNTGIVLVDRTPTGFLCVKWGLSEHLARPSITDVPDEILGG